MGQGFRWSKNLRKEIYNPDLNYRFNKKIQITTRAGEPNLYIEFKDGKMKSGSGKISNPDLILVYRNKEIMAKAFSVSAEGSLDMLLSGDLYYIGNLSYLGKFSYLTTIFPRKKRIPLSKSFPSPSKVTDEQEAKKSIKNITLNKRVDNVKYLKDPYLGKYSLYDFKNLYDLKNKWFSTHAWICEERAKNVTEFHREFGFEYDKEGNVFNPSLRQGLMLKYILSKKKAIVWEDDLLPGTTTSKRLGVQLFPELGSIAIWPELYTMHGRELNPYHISEEARQTLDHNVFPYWMDRNIREKARSLFGNPLSQRLEEFFSLYFMWKTQAISHTIPDFESILKTGTIPLINRIKDKLEQLGDNETDNKADNKAENDIKSKKNFYRGMIYALEGVNNYARNLREEVVRQLKAENIDKERKYRLERMLGALETVPEQAANDFMSAITFIWILWVSLHQENMNAGLSLGRLDQILYPYFVNDIEKLNSEEEREDYIKEVIELIGAFYLKCQDHLPLVPNLGNKLFGGSSSDQALTLGGVTRDGKNAVNDLTYIFLKVTEMLSLRDPNVNARYHPKLNSYEYLKRLCEVNINTTSTPSIHNDYEMIETLKYHGFKEDDARNWGATGCVEPTSSGKHFGHTNCMMFNLVAPFEILMNDGYHPLIHPKINDLTPDFTSQNYPTFSTLLDGYKTQLAFLIKMSVEYNNNLGKTHQIVHPTPLLSSLTQGPIDKGKDLTMGGALYNSSGVALVAFADIVDSLMSIKKIVYEENLLTLEKFKEILDNDFSRPADKIILEKIKKIPKFGSDDPETDELAASLVDYLYSEFGKYKNYRGGNYFIGFWSMSNHVAFGKLSGTLPSGRLKGKAFTPGITPAPGSTEQLLENIRSVAKIDCRKTPNNIAFNIKLIPGPNDTHEEAVEHFADYSKSYFELGGLQQQFNVVTSKVLRDAMKHPENYRWLMVRISGYNAYFISLNRDMQLELIERYEFHT
ncbi:MAG: pyruvate formate lyase family protein [Promethearchaeota archaeon]